METNNSNDVSPQGPRADGGATNAPNHRTGTCPKRKRITTTLMTAAGRSAPNVRYSSQRTIERHESNNAHRWLTKPPMKRRKFDDAFPQGTEEEAIGEAPLSFPESSLAHQGRFPEYSHIAWSTAEPDHNATLTAIAYEEEGAFVCHIEIRLEDTAETCTGFCRVQVVEMDSDISRYYRKRSNQTEDFKIEEVSKDTSLAGKVRLSSVKGEDYFPGTYTCRAEFGRFGAPNSWGAEVYVPKKYVPGYKLVDWEGEQSVIPSIETGGEESEDHDEDQATRRHTVEFSRRIDTHREQMLTTFWSTDGEDYCERVQTQILAYEFHDEHIYLEFRVRQCEASWWHLHGYMHRELTHGRFHISPSPIPNVQSDAQFDMDQMDPAIKDARLRRLQAQRERI
jgi:hypothetical protein